ncbi:MAG: metallophosphoesterase family protein [Hyphomicrobiales bacterium]
MNLSRRRFRISLNLDDTVVYAIGDVHGCLDQLLQLEKLVFDDIDYPYHKKLIVMLGDYIDRGPKSAHVIEHLMKPLPAGYKRICLLGNHEDAMLDFVDGYLSYDQWQHFGANETLLSYGLDLQYLQMICKDKKKLSRMIVDLIPSSHVKFLHSLPIVAASTKIVFVHAGIRPGVSLGKQKTRDLLYIREDFFNSTSKLRHLIVHGHTPVQNVQLPAINRINLDTQAYRTGRLSAVRLFKNEQLLLHT